jgi:hypothetical protein
MHTMIGALLERGPTCPQCGEDLERIEAAGGGVIEEPAVDGRTFRIFRRSRPASYWICNYCEWASEERPTRGEI